MKFNQKKNQGNSNYQRVTKAKNFIIGIIRNHTSVHEVIDACLTSEYEDKQALFNVLNSSKIFENRGIRIAPTGKILAEWQDFSRFTLILLDDNYEEPWGEFHIHLYMSEKCYFLSYKDEYTYHINDFTNVISFA